MSQAILRLKQLPVCSRYVPGRIAVPVFSVQRPRGLGLQREPPGEKLWRERET